MSIRKITLYVEANEYEADDLITEIYSMFEQDYPEVQIERITNEEVDDE